MKKKVTYSQKVVDVDAGIPGLRTVLSFARSYDGRDSGDGIQTKKEAAR